jgi:hypothetical protein
MKKIFFYLCFFSIFGCAGYEPLFSSKDLSFYIEDIKSVNDDIIAKKISRNLNSSKLKSANKKAYALEIQSSMDNNIASKDSKGNPLTFNMVVKVQIKVFNKKSKLLIDALTFNKNFNYNNQSNKFNLNDYKKTIMENLSNKIAQEILISLQSL